MKYGTRVVKVKDLPKEIVQGDLYLRYNRGVTEMYQVEDISWIGKKVEVEVSHNYGAVFKFELTEKGKERGIFIKQEEGKLEFIATGNKFEDWRIRMLAGASRGRR